MSDGSYFCFCCLSTDSLKNLFGSDGEDNYASMIEDLFSIKLSQDYEDCSHVCKDCSVVLKSVVNFKKQFVNTLNVLDSTGLITLVTDNNTLYINKVEHEGDLEEKYEILEEEQGNNKLIADDAVDTSLLSNKISSKDNVNGNTIDIKASKSQYIVTDDLKCPECHQMQPNNHVYHIHMNKHYSNHICEVCGKGFLSAKRLQRHLPTHARGPFACATCDAVFDKYNTLCSHRQRKHSSTPLYACPRCGSRFASFARRAAHLAHAHAHKPARECDTCGKSFLLGSELTAHIRNTHLKVKRHVCDVCGVGFVRKSDLKGHAARHTGVNEFQCGLCTKSYPRKSALAVHMRTHAAEKRFACALCDKKFNQKCTLQRHEKVHAKDGGVEV